MMQKAIVIFYFLILLTGVAFAIDNAVVLLTEEEGAMQEAPDERFKALIVNDGPDIQIIEPETNREIRNPVQIFIKFIPRNGRDVDISKLKVECLKIFNIDLTPRLLPFTTQERIKVDSAKLPTGRHKIRITIGDVQGGLTQKILEVVII